VRELAPGEFSLAEELWQGYHQQLADVRMTVYLGFFLIESLRGREVQKVF